ncbi:hypothetical protein [Fluviibacter phosphoraccumulans]|uniref:hypothetical protein n=1 Tax=Fluviibacter phosphoraccumulans TaxID=1751046 RepID=UPI001F5B9197|nr:hypothetical protein [Fluviibacter phosphoraccumulans]
MTLVDASTITGSIFNAGTMGYVTVGGGSAASLIAGSLVNQQGASLLGVRLTSGSTVAGAISNAGYVGSYVQNILGPGDITFMGYVTVAGAAVGSFVNAATGTYSGGTVGAAFINFSNAYVAQGFTNAGLITSSGVSGVAVRVQNGTMSGSFVNSGVINGGGTASGVSLSGVAGLNFITNTGLISSGTNSGLIVATMPDLVHIYNRGTISSQGPNFGSTVLYSLYVDNSQNLTTISNLGAISRPGYYGEGGVLGVFNQSGPLLINNTGSISHSSYGAAVIGVSISGVSDLNFSNSGYIGGGGGSSGVSLQIDNSTVSGVIVSTGTIVGDVNVTNSRIRDLMTVVGYFGGDISLDQVGFNGGLRNTSTVMGRISVSNGSIAGDFLNNGLAGSYAIGNATVYGSIQNLGTFNSSSQIQGSRVLGDILNNGLATGLNVTTSTIGGSFVNTGTNTGAISFNTSTVAGDVINDSTGLLNTLVIGGSSILSTRVSGFISNAGTINGYSGLLISRLGTVSGGVVNSGSLSAMSLGVAFGQPRGALVENGVVNSGSINAASNGFVLYGASSITGGLLNTGLIQSNGAAGFYLRQGYIDTILNDQGASIAGVTYGMQIGSPTFQNSASISGSLDNAGVLLASNGMGVSLSYAQVAGSINNSASGTIHGVTAISFRNSSLGGAINNSGLITATGTSSVSGAITVIDSTVSGGISNSAGTLIGAQGIFIDPSLIVGSIVNSGLVQGVTGAGIALLASTVTGDVVNAVGGSIVGLTGINLIGSSIGGAISNSGMIFGSTGSAVTASGSTPFTLINTSGASIIGAINGQINVSNSGLLALQTSTGLLSGSTASAVIDGNYYQASSGLLRIGVNGASAQGTISGNYSTLSVSGTAEFVGTGKIFVDFANGSQAIQQGQTISSVVAAGSLVGAAFSVLDNSAVVNFTYTISGNTLSLIATSPVVICGATVSISQTGPCQLDASNYPSITVNSSGSISGAALGVQVLAANIAGGVLNLGAIYGSQTGVGFDAGATLTGGITNSGLIQGGQLPGSGIAVSVAGLIGGGDVILNQSTGTIVGGVGVALFGANVVGSISNAGMVHGTSTAQGNVTGQGILLVASTVTGSVSNTGLISAEKGGVGLVDYSTLDGSIFNSGTITSVQSSAVDLAGTSTIAGQVFNIGSFGGMQAISMKARSLIQSGVYNLGTLNASGSAISVGQISLLQGGITNAGLINSAQSNALSVSYAQIAGSVINSISGTMSGVGGVNIVGSSISGSLNNIGKIYGSNYGISIGSSGYIAGGINNSGLIQGVTNSGVRLLGYSPAFLSFVSNQASGTITGGEYALQIGNSFAFAGTVTSGVTNAGLMTGNLAAVGVNGSMLAGGITNSSNGLLQSANAGVSVLAAYTFGNATVAGSVSGGINNSGVIQGTSVAGVVLSASTVSGGLNNMVGGTITGLVGVKSVNASVDVNNAGLISGTTGTAITATGSTIVVHNSASGTVLGALNGTMAVTNAGLLALQTMLNGDDFGGSLSATIDGSYNQLASGTLQFGVNGLSGTGTIAGNYSTLSVSGAATFSANSKLKVSMSTTSAVQQGQTLAGVLTAGSLTTNGFSITDNSALVDFSYATVGGVLSLIAIAPVTVACGTVSSSVQGPCLMGFNAPNVLVTGLGTISGGSTGIRVLSGSIVGGIVNQGSVIGTNYGIGVTQGATTITGSLSNAGLIQSTSNSMGAGVLLSATTLLSGFNNTSSGSVIGYTGLSLSAGSTLSGGLNNSGLIQGLPRRGINVASSVVQGGIVNTSGTITGFSGLLVLNSSVTGGLTNSGLISGASAGGVFLNASNLQNGLNNQSAGTISGVLLGLGLSGSSLSGGITNAGLITGTLAGISLSASNLQNGLSNNGGTVSSGGSGVVLSLSTVAGGLTNSGLITGLAGVGLNLSMSGLLGVINNVTTGTISGLTHGLQLSSSVLNGNLTNAGLITGTSFAGVFVISSTVTGGVQNTGGTLAGGAQGLRVNSSSVLSGVTNSGLVTGSVVGVSLANSNVANGLANLSGGSIGGISTGVFVSGSQVSGGVSNASNAIISASNGTAVVLLAVSTVSGGFTNAGLITGGSFARGVSVHYASTINGGLNNLALATISGGYSGLAVTSNSVINGGLTNAGLITGGLAAGLMISVAGLQGGLNNLGGSITGGVTGLQVVGSTIAGGISNTGYIQGLTSVGVALAASQIAGNLHNAGGTIAGVQNGLSLSGSVITTGLTNAGLITGTSATGLVLSNASTINGGLNNVANATISGGVTGLQVSANSVVTGGLTNAGLITGGTYAINAPGLTSIVSTGTASQFVGTVSASSATLSVANGSTLTAGSPMVLGSVNVANGAQINLTPSTASTVSGGVAVTNGFTNAGVVNVGQSAATITGNYAQTSLGNLFVPVVGSNGSGTAAGAYGQLHVTGAANFAANTTITVSMNAQNSVLGGGTLAGVVTAGTLTTNGFTIVDNSALVNFVWSTVGGTLSLIAVANPNVCGATISGAQAGPCQVAYNNPNLTVTSLGSITGGAQGLQVLSGQITGHVANQGLISGSQTGIQFAVGSTLSGGLTNSGLITGSSLAGVVMSGTLLQGGLNNLGGSITGGVTGLQVVGSTIAGGISNTGYIQGLTSVGVALAASQIAGNLHNAGGTIAGVIYGVQLNSSVLNGNLTNSGLISGISSSGLLLSLSTISGLLSNAGSGSITGQTGLVMTNGFITNGLTNAGLISGSSLSGVSLANSSVGGGINNLGGTMSGVNQAGLSLASMSITGSLSNTGLITGVSSSGVSLVTTMLTGNVANLGGTMSGLNTGLSVVASQVGGNLTNTGLITGISSSGLVLTATTISGLLSNAGSGSITGQTGLVMTNSFIANGLTNAGLISGSSLSGVSLANSSVGGGINNLGGTMSGVNQAGLSLNATTVSGGLTNAGLITSSSAAGIALSNATTVIGGLNNVANATISGGVTGLSVSANSVVNGGLTNAGLITGGAYAINAPSLTSIVSNGLNAQFIGTVSASNASLNITSGTLTGANGLNVSSVSVAGGTQLNLVSSTASTISGGITAPNGVTNSGVVNVGMAAATITGNYVQAASGALRVGALGSNNHGSLNVTGLASFAPNATIQMVTITGATFANGNTLSGVINAGSLSATTFNVASNSSLLSFTASLVGNSVNIITQVSTTTSIPSAVASQGNTAGAGAANSLNTVFNSFVAGSSTYASMNNAMAAFANMSSNAQISQAVSQSLPVLSSNSPLQTLGVLTAINQSIEARSLKLRGVSSGHEMYGNNTVWMKPFGSWMNQGNMNGAYGFKANAGGLIIGADHQWDDKARFGGAFAWGNSSANSNMGGQNQTSNMYQFVGYGAYAVIPSVNVNFQANGGWNNNTTNRNIGFLGTSAQASYDSAVWHAGVGVDRPTKLSEDTTFIPQARFDYTWIRNQGYSETGAAYGMGLNVGSQTYQTSVLGVDGKVQHKIGDHHMVSTNLGVGYNFSPTQTWVAASYQGASALQFTTTGVNPSALSGKAGLGYTYKVKEGVDVGVRYDIDVQEQYTNQIATAKARWNF